MTLKEVEIDPRIKPDICGVIHVGGTGIEWICIKKPHAEIYTRRDGSMVFSNNPSADRHYFVRRWPKLDREQDGD